VEGKIAAAKYCRENKKPYLGVCLGMQVMVMEYARSKMGLEGATSEEFSAAKRQSDTANDSVAVHEDPSAKAKDVVVFMPEGSKDKLGGTMRLGARETVLSLGSLAAKVYGATAKNKSVMERHRHRYEVDPERVGQLEKAGLIFSGRDTTGIRMEICELPQEQHPYYLGTQFHPEFKSRPNRPSPPFYALVAAALGRTEGNVFSAAGKMWQLEELRIQKLQAQSLEVPVSPLRDVIKRKTSMQRADSLDTSGVLATDRLAPLPSVAGIDASKAASPPPKRPRS
jgi:CTP synthase